MRRRSVLVSFDVHVLTAHNPRSDTLVTGCRGGVICLWKDGVARRFSGK